MAYLEVLPDPNYSMSPSGEPGGTLGQPFASVELSLEEADVYDRGTKGRFIHRTQKKNKWAIKVKYNPMTEAQFTPIYNFLMYRYGSYKPFYISLPQYAAPHDPTFAAYVALNGDLPMTDALSGGQTKVTCTYSGASMPNMGDIFNIVDPENSMHTTAYMVTRVDTPALHGPDTPLAGEIFIHCAPRIACITNEVAGVRFHNPLFKVIQSQDIQKYSLGNNNLYSFSLSLMEAT